MAPPLAVLAAAALTILELTGTARRLPEVKAHRLDGRAITLPSGLDGKVNLVLVAFRREQQAAVDTWAPAARALATRHRGFAWYELPVIGKVPGVVRWFIDNGMRGGIRDAADRARTVSLYGDKAPLKAALGIADEGTIHAFLVDRTGKVLWAATGTLDGPAPPTSLEAAVRAALAAGPPEAAAGPTPAG